MSEHKNQHHGEGHSHHSHAGHAHTHGSGRALLYSLIFTTLFAAIEVFGGLWGNSLALLSDAGHMFTDSASLGIGAFAAWLALRPASRVHSFGLQRAEVLGALVNAVFMIVVVAAIVASAIERLTAPAEPVAGMAVLVIGGIGLGVNIAVAALLMRGEQTLNVRGALLHVLGDMLGSVAALVAGAVIMWTGWTPIDPLLSLLVAVLIGISALRLLREVVHVLMEAVPSNLDAAEVGDAMAQVDGVRAVHDLHIWTLSSSQQALAAHVEVKRLADWGRILPQIQCLLAAHFAISHTTLQPEDPQAVRDCGSEEECGLTLRSRLKAGSG